LRAAETDGAVTRRAPGGSRAGIDHADDGNAGRVGDLPDRGDLDGVARDDEHLHVAPNEVLRDLEREGADLRERAWAVREPRGVADIADRLVREEVEDRA